MSEARAITNLIGNGVATVIVAKWERSFDAAKAARVLAGDYEEDLLPLADVEDSSTAVLQATAEE
jgi:aerobic C4-dicarboxylate transport protein